MFMYTLLLFMMKNSLQRDFHVISSIMVVSVNFDAKIGQFFLLQFFLHNHSGPS